VKYGDVSCIGVSGVRDDGFRRIWGFGWKGNLEQTCRWSGKTPARLVFDEVQTKFEKLSEPGIVGIEGWVEFWSVTRSSEVGVFRRYTEDRGDNEVTGGCCNLAATKTER